MTSSNFRRSRRFVASLLLVLIIVGSVVTFRLVQWRTVTIGIMSSPLPSTFTNVVHVQAKPGQERVYAISLRCRGKLNGVGAIALDGSPELVVSNDFDTQIRKRDWYSTNCEIALITTNVQTGTVVISYQFHD